MRFSFAHTVWIYFIVAALPVGATDRNWPGAAPCATTLQACVDGATDNDRILIATNSPIGEDVNLYNRSLTLTAADGYAPTFGPTHWLSITSSPIAGNQTVSASNLRFVDGYVYVNYSGIGTGSYDLRELSLTRASSDSANYIEVNASGTTYVTLYHNRVSGVPRDLNNGLIKLASSGNALNATAYYNQLTSASAAAVGGAGIFVDAHASASTGASGTIRIHGNEVRGSFNRGGIVVSEGLFTPTPSSISARVYNNVVVGLSSSADANGGTGIAFIVNAGSIDAQAINNTVSRCYTGLLASQWDSAGASAAINGTVKNNVLLANYGLRYVAGTVATGLASHTDYNLINAATPYQGVAAGANDITANARVVIDTQPRLRSDSPGIDTADSTTLGFGLIFNTLPTNDADGLRRFSGVGAKADMGAFEFGNTHVLQTSKTWNTVGNYTDINSPAMNGQDGAYVFSTPNFNAGVVGTGVADDLATGVYYDVPRWSVFNENGALLTIGEHFNIWSPASGSGLFQHKATALNSADNDTTLDDSSVNGQTDRTLQVAQNWSVNGIYNPRHIAIRYDVADSRWKIHNGSSAGIPLNASFNVYSQQPSPNAFVVTANTLNTSAGDLAIDHALLSGAPCALIQVTREWTGNDFLHAFNVAYEADHRWHITDYSNALPLGSRFHVLVDPAQVFLCTDRIFIDGLD
jgi:hypothetical protein